MGYGLYKVRYEKVIDLLPEEVEAVIDAGQYPDNPTPERFVALDFEDTGPDMTLRINSFKAKVRPEVFEAVKRLAEDGDTFVVAWRGKAW